MPGPLGAQPDTGAARQLQPTPSRPLRRHSRPAPHAAAGGSASDLLYAPAARLILCSAWRLPPPICAAPASTAQAFHSGPPSLRTTCLTQVRCRAGLTTFPGHQARWARRFRMTSSSTGSDTAFHSRAFARSFGVVPRTLQQLHLIQLQVPAGASPRLKATPSALGCVRLRPRYPTHTGPHHRQTAPTGAS